VTPPVALTIAGSDSGGGAGIQADLKTFVAHGVFGASVLTALTAQNTVGVRAVRQVDLDFVAEQLSAIVDDLPLVAVKTGMLGDAATIGLVARWARRLPRLVVDPVLMSSSGVRLADDTAAHAYREQLFAVATVVTPNAREAATLTAREVRTVDDAISAAHQLGATGAEWVVIKGGHLEAAGEAVDVVWHAGQVDLLRAPWVETANSHGTGCTFAAAVAARLARGEDVPTALRGAKSYVHRALLGSARWRLGAGHGPLSWEVT
jgi:hydroxymethylpyrimidine/phosphomethylpyrimidine kinase